MRRILGAIGCVLCVWAGALPDAQAQARYHCRDERGNTYTWSRPCPDGTRTTAAVAGPAPAQYSSQRSDDSRSVRLAPEAPEHYRFLSGRCRSLDENLQGAYGRGIKADVIEGMRREYRRDCQEDEQEARSRISEERRGRDAQRREHEKSSKLAALASQEQQEQQARQTQQCAESRRILANKRARTDLTDGEKNDLRRFEATFAERCNR